MKLPPPEILMTWPKPNYIDPHTRGPGVLIVNIVCVSVAFIVTLLRLYTRFRITCSPGIDDILIVIAMVSEVPRTGYAPVVNRTYRASQLPCAP